MENNKEEALVEKLVKIYETTDKTWKQIAKENNVGESWLSQQKLKYYEKTGKKRFEKPRKNYKHVPIEKAIDEYVKTDVSWKELADKYNVAPSTIRKKRERYATEKKLGVIKKENGKIRYISIQEIEDLYEQNMNVIKISHKLGIPPQIIRDILRERMLKKDNLLTEKFVQRLLKEGFAIEEIEMEAQRRGLYTEEESLIEKQQEIEK